MTKIILCGATALGIALGAAAPASADPSVFGNLSCGCHENAPADSSLLTDNLDRGIQQGLAGPVDTAVQ